MQKRDGRSIPDAALEMLRERAVAMHEAGNTQRAIAAALARVCGLWAYFSICWTTDALKSKGLSARTG